VVSRCKPFQLYFESGFPHGKSECSHRLKAGASIYTLRGQ
jgi:hypothetical protein